MDEYDKKQLECILTDNEVFVYVVWHHEYYDYTKGCSRSEPTDCYYDKETADLYAMEENIRFINNNCTNKDLISILGESTSLQEQLQFIEDNFDEIYGIPQFGCESCYEIWRVKKLPILTYRKF